jgi:hypothetical protein
MFLVLQNVHWSPRAKKADPRPTRTDKRPKQRSRRDTLQFIVFNPSPPHPPLRAPPDLFSIKSLSTIPISELQPMARERRCCRRHKRAVQSVYFTFSLPVGTSQAPLSHRQASLETQETWPYKGHREGLRTVTQLVKKLPVFYESLPHSRALHPEPDESSTYPLSLQNQL